MKAEYKLITRSKEQYKQYQREELKIHLSFISGSDGAL